MARKQKQADVGINMTPMIDVCFQLITFFMLASSYASAEIDKLVKVPTFDNRESQAQIEQPRYPFRVVINLAATAENSKELQYIKVGPIGIGTDLNKLKNMLQALKDKAREQDKDAKLVVIVRAHRTLATQHVAAVMHTAGSIGIPDVQFASPVGEAGVELLRKKGGN